MTAVLRRLAGRRSDWHLDTPSFRLPRPHLSGLGPLAVVASVIVSWFAFSNAQGEDGNVQLGLFVGAASILLMAWSFVLAVRIRLLEPLFGGLDSMYRVHRWAGSLATVLMFWHVQVEPEVENGILGASKSVANQAEDLAGTGEIMIYILIGLSLVRWVPYRWWRWTHKLLGVPFAFASWHFFTAEKPYANGSNWGIWFGGFMLAGLAAFIWRILVRDAVMPGHKYTVATMENVGSVTTLGLAPKRRAMPHRAGQFAFLKVQHPGLREPHAFTIASSPDSTNLRFVVRELGDWTRSMRQADLVGHDVIVEGPYGTFEPLGSPHQQTVWVAGGVGITPFLSAIDGASAGSGTPPHLFYAVRSREENPIADELIAADADGRIVLHLYSSADGERLTTDELERMFGNDGLRDAHIGLCGPTSLVNAMDTASRQLGASSIHREDFDIRQGFGPDLSIEIDDLVNTVRNR
jgi:predicted ferric reductase